MEALVMLLNDYTFQTVALGSAILGIISGFLGSFAVLRKQSLLGDGVSHAALPGVVMAFLLTGSKNTEFLLLGALLSGLLATLFIVQIVKHTRIKFDSALALILSVFFGLGMVLLTYVQKIPNSNQAGLKRFIFGQAATLLQRDVVLMLVCGTFLLALLVVFWKEFKLFTFDSDFAQSIGFSPRKLNLLLSFMIVLAIIVGLQTVGVILMSAMLIAPAVAARQWTNKLFVMVMLAAVFGALSGIAGTTVSSLIPKLPTGPCIVLFISLIVLFSLLFAPERGIISRIYRHRQTKLALQVERR
ncbi:metal ABC transporter permease [Desulfosporosinus meridiei]|uniref:ABC-type Mn2+/Zn2+ transport system, permease component n=1 Tax=Desulfosporosinus meridiei (strain ATCC BAA-275 / DSM 13257 / KCTC 12902 / NCIMB 13706 / S10) TaxID=768704 RepID=J7ILW5_DESMD|nr:iron chelate uptake ABC transporter family permease subunit [Desulfosporosinus meridiei]AFQ42570.1 ABC-type Mn2+/Zn2+ transport system, permease component [Desulfosporosinus meridiei DSM 13257]